MASMAMAIRTQLVNVNGVEQLRYVVAPVVKLNTVSRRTVVVMVSVVGMVGRCSVVRGTWAQPQTIWQIKISQLNPVSEKLLSSMNIIFTDFAMSFNVVINSSLIYLITVILFSHFG